MKIISIDFMSLIKLITLIVLSIKIIELFKS